MSSTQPLIVVAGATGNLGSRIVDALLARGADVRALVRTETDSTRVDQLTARGANVVRVELADIRQLTEACAGAACVVSALQGLRDVIVDVQTGLLEAAVAAEVPRFIPSDYSTDFTQLPPGENRNFDLRREFHERLATADIAATSIFNGAFAEVLTYNIPLLDFQKRSVGYWEDVEWRIDFTTMDDTAAFTAAAALDPTTPRWLRIASFQISPRELAAAAEDVIHQSYTLNRLGRRDELAAYTRHERAAHPEGEHELMPRWQQMQYMLGMFSAQNNPLDNARYPDIHWTSAREMLAARGTARS